jgi:mono/diheme cytochrome c family protein
MRKSTAVLWSLLCLILLAACNPTGQNPASTPLPTSTTIPTYEFGASSDLFSAATAVPAEATAEATVEATAEVAATSEATAEAAAPTTAAGSGALDPVAVERGKGRYDALACADCHGADGAGTDEGSSLITYAGSEAEFIGFMRSGGTLGPDHQFATNRLSDSGGKNLYQYLVSLRGDS